MIHTSTRLPTKATTVDTSANTTQSQVRVGPWTLHGRLAQGSIADVFAASPTSAGNDSAACYALKLLREEWYEHPLILNQFRREAALGRRLSHPYLVSSVYASLNDAPYFHVMPRLNGETLNQLLQRDAWLSLPRVLGIVRQAASGLAELHRQKLLHNDLKPANLFVSDAGHVTLLDLGSVREIKEAENIWQRPLLGTAAYIAPEQFVSSFRINERSDLYSLGVILYQALSGGKLPIEAASLEELASKVIREKPELLQNQNPLIPREVSDLVQKLLAKDPARRLDSAATLVQELAKLEIATLGQIWQDDFWELVNE